MRPKLCYSRAFFNRFFPISLFLFFVLFSLCSAKNNEYKAPQWQVGRVQYWSSEGKIGKIVQGLPQVQKYTTQILQHIERSEKRILQMLRDQTPPSSKSEIRPCNFDRKTWVDSVEPYFRIRGWKAPEKSCVSEFYHTKLDSSDNPPVTTDDIYIASEKRGKILTDVPKEKIQDIAYNFSDPDVSYNFTYSTADQECTLHPQGAVRIENKWYLLTSYTNDQKSKQLQDYKRQFIQEAIRVENGKVEVAKMKLRRGSYFNASKDEVSDDATTAFSTWKGGATSSIFDKIPFDKNRAIVDALDEGDLAVQQASDAVTPSSIAILFLPLGLNLVPIALLAQVSTMTTLLYTLMSDVLTVFPLGIKGVELIDIGNKKVRRVFTRITSTLSGKLADTAGAEVWVAECRAGSGVKTQGIIFLTLAIIFLVFGIVAEFVAKNYATKRRKQRSAMQLPLKNMGDSIPPDSHSQDVGVHGGFVDDVDISFDPNRVDDEKAV